ncbi:MAG: hypothetical protein AAGH15_20440, partial [Myxococcota bacterium]
SGRADPAPGGRSRPRHAFGARLPEAHELRGIGGVCPEGVARAASAPRRRVGATAPAAGAMARLAREPPPDEPPELEASADEPQARDPGPTEVSLLVDARRVLDARPREALRLTRAHREAFPAGRLALEREVLAIDAHVRLGERRRARRRAAAFVERWPDSPHAAALVARGLVAPR